MQSAINKLVYLGIGANNIPDLAAYVSGNNDDVPACITSIGPIASINLLVGANNAGKSRFMRAVMKSDTYFLFKSDETLKAYESLIESLISLRDVVENGTINFSVLTNYKNSSNNLRFLNDSHKELFDNDFKQKITLDPAYIDQVVNDIKRSLKPSLVNNDAPEILNHYFKIFRIFAEIINLDLRSGTWFSHYPTLALTIEYFNQADKIFLKELLLKIQLLSFLIENNIESFKPLGKIYIPILRTARTILFDNESDQAFQTTEQSVLNTIFKQTIIKSYKINPDDVDIHTGLDLYEMISRARSASREKRRLFDEFESFLSENFFQGKEFEIVARYAEKGKNEHLYVSIDKTEHEIHFLGDGIQALIMLLYPIFLAKPGSWIFIEEPEVHLHPGMQRLFIKTLLDNQIIQEKKLIIFLTTHSNHLFDIAVATKQKTSIFAFQKIQEQPPLFSLNSTVAGQLNILNLLEVTNSSVFMANCAFWVEGPTDRVYLRKYLNEYVKKYYPQLTLHEDLEYCFFEYAGSNLEHYIFSKEPESLDNESSDKIKAWFLSNRIFLVADSDKNKEGKHSKLLKQQNSNFVYYVLPVREVENLLSPEIIMNQLPKIFNNWKKSHKQNWSEQIIANPIKAGEYENEYLAKFVIDKYNTVTFPKIQGTSGTLTTRYKNKLAYQIEFTLEWDEMSLVAQELAKKMFQFIIIHNPLLSKSLMLF